MTAITQTENRRIDNELSLNRPAPAQKRRYLVLITRDCKVERRLAVLHLRVDLRSVFEQQRGEFDVAVGGGFMKRREAAFGLSRIYIRAVSDQKTRDGDPSGSGGGMEWSDFHRLPGSGVDLGAGGQQDFSCFQVTEEDGQAQRHETV